MTVRDMPAIRTAGEWSTQTRYDDGALTALAADWDDLYRRCSTATPFLSHAWLRSSWHGYGRPGHLVLVLVWRAGRLVGAAPLLRGHRAGLTVLTPLGAGISDFGDVLLDDAYAGEAARRLAEELAAGARGAVIDLPEVPPDAAVWRVVDAWPRRTWRLPASVCLDLPARPIDEIIQALPPETARQRRKKRKKIAAAGIETTEAADRTEAGALVTALLRLHREQWNGRGMNPEHGRPRFAAHLRRAVPAMVERGQAAVRGYRLDGELVAVDVLLVGPGMVRAYLYGFRPDLRDRIDVTQLFLEQDLALARRRERPVLSMMRGDEEHKRRWRPRETRNQRVLLNGSGGVPAPLYASLVRGRHRLAELAKTRLPWLREAVRHVRG
jgi:CelD/BcsL family acetyltransferase involved in cellulose biosynthesis